MTYSLTVLAAATDHDNPRSVGLAILIPALIILGIVVWGNRDR